MQKQIILPLLFAYISIKPGAGQKLGKYCLSDNETKWELMESFPVKGTRDQSLGGDRVSQVRGGDGVFRVWRVGRGADSHKRPPHRRVLGLSAISATTS